MVNKSFIEVYINLWGLVGYSVAKRWFGNRLEKDLNIKLRNLDLTVEVYWKFLSG